MLGTRISLPIISQMFEDKETETEVLVGELDRTRDVVNALQDENRELKVRILYFRLFMISVLLFSTTAL